MSALAAAAILAAGCSAHASQTAHVASTFTDATTPTVTTPPTAPPSAPGSTDKTGATTGTSVASSDARAGSASGNATPCPPPSPQLFVEGKHADVKNGQISFSYLAAQRICAGDESARFVATGTTVATKPVSPSAVVLLLAPNAGSDELQVPAPALPAAMAADTGATFFAITLDGAGAITRIEQSYRP